MMKKLLTLSVVSLSVVALSACSPLSESSPGTLDTSNVSTSSAVPSSTPSQSVEPTSEPSLDVQESDAVSEDAVVTERPEDHLEDIRAALIDAMNGEYSSMTHSALVETMAQYNVTLDPSVYNVLSKNESSSAVVVGLQPQPEVEYHHDVQAYTWTGNVRFAMTHYADRNGRAQAVSELSAILADKLASGESTTHRLVWTMIVADDGSTATLSLWMSQH